MTAFAALASALQGRYRLDRELGQGGMATVYLAEDLKHHRLVAIKVLKPELAASLGPERFLREIEIAARLDHPHILPVYDSGEAEGLLYYVMPFVEGESLRARLVRERQLPLDDALQIARQVADALSYAHSRDVVHRDIKPENILLAEGHARVADFGIARAITQAGGDRLTQTGLAIGTPAYMSPEQAAGARDLDGRSDLYSLGCVLYEMLAGEPPFTGPPDTLVHQHLTAEPPPITVRRPAVPPAVAAVLMRALAKTPADRFSPAAAFAEALRTGWPAGSPYGAPVAATALGADPLRVAGVFAAAAAVLLALVYGLMLALGLPTWVLIASAVILVLGLPFAIATSVAVRRRMRGTAGGTLGDALTWRRTLVAGAAALGALAFGTAGYLASRALGIGPAGTLIATGAMAQREPVILADFENRTSDTAHGATVTELMRIGLSQSRAISVLDPVQVSRILQLMRRDPAAGLPEAVALEAAEREGVKAVVTGEIASVGTGFALSARVVAADGTVLTAVQEQAADDDAIVAAVDRLSQHLRERIGEGLRSIRWSARLEQATTGSLQALRLLTQGFRASNQGDDPRAMQLIEEAIALDSTFAMAHRKLAVLLRNNAERRARAVEAARRAYQYRDRLTERERYLVIAGYHMIVTQNRDQEISAYQTVLDQYPDELIALNNMGVLYSDLRDYGKAAAYYSRALLVDSTNRLYYSNLAVVLGLGERFDSAQTVIEGFARRFPGNPEVTISRILLAATRKDYDLAERLGASLMTETHGRVFWEAIAYEWLAGLDAMRGRMAAAERSWSRSLALSAERGLEGQYLARTARRAVIERLLRDDPVQAHRMLDEALRRFPLARLAPLDRPYAPLAMAYAAADDPTRAHALLTEYDRTPEADHAREMERDREGALGLVALAEGRPGDAIAAFRRFDDGNACGTCATAWLARAYDRAGNLDSARVLYQQLAEAPSDALWFDAGHLGYAYLRLGQLYQERGERQTAADYYGRLVSLWNAADPDMQAWVRQARAALAAIAGDRL